MEELIKNLFTDWKLDTWANVLEIVGFGITIFSLVVALIVKSELTKLKMSYIFDKRIKSHLKNLTKTTTKINQFLNDYANNINSIKTELRKSISELEDMKSKLGFWESWKSKKLIYFIKRRLSKSFDYNEKVKKSPFWNYVSKHPIRLYKTTKNDVYLIHEKLHEVISQVENIKENKNKSL